MATTITWQVGALTASRTAAGGDRQVNDFLLDLALALGADPAWTPKQKLEHIATATVEHYRRTVRRYRVQTAQEAAQGTPVDF